MSNLKTQRIKPARKNKITISDYVFTLTVLSIGLSILIFLPVLLTDSRLNAVGTAEGAILNLGLSQRVVENPDQAGLK